MVVVGLNGFGMFWCSANPRGVSPTAVTLPAPITNGDNEDVLPTITLLTVSNESVMSAQPSGVRLVSQCSRRRVLSGTVRAASLYVIETVISPVLVVVVLML